MRESNQYLQSSLSHSEPEYAGFWLRCFALCLDDFVLGCIGALNVLLLSGVLYYLLKVSGANLHSEMIQLLAMALLNGISFLLNLLIGWLYYSLMESSEAQATVGKMVTRLRVTRKDGARLSFARASVRFWARMGHVFVLSIVGVLTGAVLLGLCLPGINTLADVALFFGILSMGLFFGGVAGYLPALFTARRQTLHDLIAGTVVVKAD